MSLCARFPCQGSRSCKNFLVLVMSCLLMEPLGAFSPLLPATSLRYAFDRNTALCYGARHTFGIGGRNGVATAFRMQSSPAIGEDLQSKASGQGRKVCIVGGGFGGLYTALNLAKLAPLQDGNKADITLIDKNDRFVFLPMLYELVTGELKDWEVAPVFTDLLKGTNIKFIQGQVVEHSKADKTLTVKHASVAGGEEKTVGYDDLVVALGSESTSKNVPGAAEHAIPFARVQDARRLRSELDSALKRAPKGSPVPVVIVGGGYSGVELACNIADRYGSVVEVTLVHGGDKVIQTATGFSRDKSARRLANKNIRAMMRTKVVKMSNDTITVEEKDGEMIDMPYGVCVWSAGVRASEAVVRDLGLATTRTGRLAVTPRLKVVGEDSVYALGDIADCYDALDTPMPGNAQVAIQQADCVAWNIHSSLIGGNPVSFRYQALGEMMHLGGMSATLSSPLFGLNTDGAVGHALRRITYLIRMPTPQHKLKVAVSWAQNIPRDLLNFAKASRET